MDELLNKLIEKRWIPFPNEWADCYYFKFSNRGHDFMCCSSDDDDEYTHNYTYSWRDITSKESGLWQFVCENGMVKSIGSEIEIKNLNEGYGVVRDTDYQYRGIVSYLKDESELEQFLLNSIIIDD